MSRRGQRALRGTVTVPGDKSISHRALILAAVAEGTSIVAGLGSGRDVAATAGMLAGLGAAVALDRENHKAKVKGWGSSGPREPGSVLDAGNSGTSLRTIAGVCAAAPGLSVLTGDDSLRRRPMLRVVVPLRQMGARVDGRAHGEFAPLAIRGGPLAAADVELDVASAQVKTAVLLAGLAARGITSVTEPHRSRDHTERMLETMGAEVTRSETTVSIRGGATLTARDTRIPGDISSALFLVAAALLIEGSDLTIEGVGLNPSRTAALDVLLAMGADVTWETKEEWGGEPVGSLRARHSALRAIAIGGAEIPGLIDEIPALAVMATFAEGETVISDAGELRVKESDRIETLVRALGEVGADAVERSDGLVVRGSGPWRAAEIDAGGDHRIAMALAVGGLASGQRVRVRSWSSVETSFPEFLDVVARAQRGGG